MRFKLPNKSKGIEIFSSEIGDGPMNFDMPKGQKNIEKFLAKNKITKPLITCSQPHGTKIAFANESGRINEVDGILTNHNLALGIKTADCVPLMLFDPNTALIGAVHISCKNLLAGIISISLKNSLRQLPTANCKLLAFLGPHIHVKNYPLKSEAVVKVKGMGFEKYLVKIGKNIHFDLTRATIDSLVEIGFLKENIIDSKIDSFSSKKFYSSRQSLGKGFGVFITVIFKDGKKVFQK